MKCGRELMWAAVCCVSMCAGIVSAAEIVVAPDGTISTLSAARDAVRAMRAAGEKGDIDVVIQDGLYVLDETLIFGLEDSAPEGAVTRYRAAEGAAPVISGERAIAGWKKSELQGGKIWVADVPWTKGGNRFHCLYDGDKALPRARSEGTFTMERESRKYAGEMRYRESFKFNDGVKDWPNLDDIEVFTSPSMKWLINYLPLAKVDEAEKRAFTTVPATYSFGGAFHVENCLDYLNAPGEWALDSHEGKLYYWPESGTPGDAVVATALDELFRVQGLNDASLEGRGDKPVTGLVFEGLTFRHADRQRWEPGDKGIQHDWNMWNKDNGLIRFDGAADCVVKGCTFQDSGSDGVRLDRYCQRITVCESIFTRLGGTAVQLAGYGPGLKDVNHHNVILDNEISDVGALFWHSPGVSVWQSGHNRIAHNHIYDQGYAGMVIEGVRRRFFVPIHGNKAFAQWHFPKENREHSTLIRWDEISKDVDFDWPAYEPYMHARKNVVEFNELHDCLQRLHDGNCIYLSGNGDGNIVRHNVTYNHPRGSTIRTDDDSHGSVITGNLMFGTTGNQGHKMKGLNVATDNVFVNSLMTTGSAGNRVDPTSTLSRNVFYHTGAVPTGGFHFKLDTVRGGIDNNVYWHTTEGVAAEALASQRKRDKAGLNDRNSVAADPLFIDPMHGDFGVRPGSPLLELGIKPLPLETVRLMGCSRDRFIDRFAAGIPMPVKQPPAASAGHKKPTKAKRKPQVTLELSGNELVLDAKAAALTGKKNKVEDDHHIGFWTEPSDTASWKLDVAAPGKYAVKLHYSSAPERDGSDVVVNVAGKQLTSTVKTTGSWDTYKLMDMGTVEIEKAGATTFTIGFGETRKKALFNLKSVVLVPVAK